MLDLAGKLCPEFKAVLSSGEIITEQDLKGSATVLFFYPKDFTPGCTMEVCAIRDIYKTLSDKGVKVFGISKDEPNKHQKFREKYNLPYELISDANSSICESFGVWQEKSMFGKKYMGILRSTFMLDAELLITKVWPKVSPSKHANDILTSV